jgi:RND family efflux transporter MFP subunit
MKTVLILLACVAILVIAAVAVRLIGPVSGGGPDERGASLMASAERRDIQSSLLLTGEVVPAFQVDIKPEVGGKVQQLHVSTGRFVHKGEPLATIDDTDLLTDKAAAETEIAGAQLAVDKNRGNYERAAALYKEKLISKEVYDNLAADYAIAENTLEKARSRLQTVEDRLRKTRIDAPAGGTVLDVLVNEGQVVVAAASVNAGTVLMNFADLSRLLINSHVNQVDAAKLKKGQEIVVNISGSGEETLRARIEFIAPVATVRNNIKGFQVQALIKDNDGRLKPGMSVSMTVPVAKATGAVSVPVSAIFREEKSQVVYVRKGGQTERRSVQVGITDLGYAEILSGLDEGEEILLFAPPGASGKS